MGERSRELLILITGDIACFVVSLYLTLLVRYLQFPTVELLNAHFGPFLMLAGLWLFIFYIAGLYDKHTVFLKRLLFSRILHTQIANIIIAAMLFIILPFSIAPKTNLIIYLLVSVILITVWRLKVYNYLSPKTTHKAILIADGQEAIELVDEVNNNERYNYSFVRIIESTTPLSAGDFERKLLTLIEKENISMIVANPRGEQMEHILPTLFDLAFLKFEFTFLDFHKVYEDTFDKVPLSALHYNWFINHISQSKSVGYNVIKRSIDIFCAILLLIPSLGLFIFIALAIKLGDKGPLLYKTERLGQFNKPFTLYKFRTKNGADVGNDALHSVLVDTKVGTFLRKTRLDELPQLFNVLKGDLSFIGPRPEMPALTAVYAEKIQYYNTRHLIKPGLSGWAQIKNNDAPRGGVDIERTTVKLSYDLFYLKNRSLLLDLQITLQTISTLLRRTGS